MSSPVIFAINPGSTSTRIALFQGQVRLAEQELVCPREQLARCARVVDQTEFRTCQVREFLERIGRDIGTIDAVAARGGPLRPIPGGVYRINDIMLADAAGEGFIEHASKIACIIADRLCRDLHVPRFVVDPVSTDELADLSRISGLKDLPRQGLTHALNMKRVARQFSLTLGRPYPSLNLITVHLGGGASIAVHHGGRMIDSVDANGEGPFSPERSGGLRTDSLVRLACERGQSFREIVGMLTRQAGLVSHLGTTDSREVEKRVQAGDAYAKLVYQAMAYSVAKHICALAAAVAGKVDGVIITGGLARSEMFTGWVKERVSFLAPVAVYPGEDEMAALCEGVARALKGEEIVRTYPTGEAEANGNFEFRISDFGLPEAKGNPQSAIHNPHSVCVRTFAQILNAAQKSGPKRLAIAGSSNEELAEALEQAQARGIITPVVFETAEEAVAAVRSGAADALMKGGVDTATFMRAVLDRDAGLRGQGLLSHVAVVEAMGRLLLITDGGIVLNPTLDEKVKIIANAVAIARGLGIEMPKVAVLAAVEKENPKMPETLEAAALSRMNLPGCVVQGPLAVDNAICPEAAKAKGIGGPVAGQADILLVPSVLVGNIFAKGIMYFGGCEFGGVVAGTTRPVMFLSRSDTARTKLNTIALGVLLSERSL